MYEHAAMRAVIAFSSFIFPDKVGGGKCIMPQMTSAQMSVVAMPATKYCHGWSRAGLERRIALGVVKAGLFGILPTPSQLRQIPQRGSCWPLHIGHTSPSLLVISRPIRNLIRFYRILPALTPLRWCVLPLPPAWLRVIIGIVQLLYAAVFTPALERIPFVNKLALLFPISPKHQGWKADDYNSEEDSNHKRLIKPERFRGRKAGRFYVRGTSVSSVLSGRSKGFNWVAEILTALTLPALAVPRSCLS